MYSGAFSRVNRLQLIIRIFAQFRLIVYDNFDDL